MHVHVHVSIVFHLQESPTLLAEVRN